MCECTTQQTQMYTNTKTQKQTITIDFQFVPLALLLSTASVSNFHCKLTLFSNQFALRHRLDKCEKDDYLFGCIFFLFVSSTLPSSYFFAVCFFFFSNIGKLLSLTNWNSIFEWASECTSVNEWNKEEEKGKKKQYSGTDIGGNSDVNDKYVFTLLLLGVPAFFLLATLTQYTHIIHPMQQTYFPNNWQIFMNEFQFVLYVSI